MLCYIGEFEEAVKGRRYESRCDVDGSLIDMHFDATCRMMTLQRALARDGNGKEYLRSVQRFGICQDFYLHAFTTTLCTASILNSSKASFIVKLHCAVC